MPAISIEQSGAFIETFTLPPTGDGPLAGLRFAVKDIIDVAGRRTGGGNPTWLETHPPAIVSAVCVEQLLAAGAECAGKTISDELALSLLGQNHHYGTPLNPAAPQRVPGGSSSGSASAVACGLVDFALGTDSGGSVRVPASNCGIWGWRPTHGIVSIAGVMPLSPTYDTVGILARDADVMQRAASVLLASKPPADARPEKVYLLTEAFALADAEVRAALEPAIALVTDALGVSVQKVSLAELCGDASAADLTAWLECYLAIMGAEVASCHGGWIAEAKPEFGPIASAGFEFVQTADRSRVGKVIARREHYCRQFTRALGPRDLVCLPSAPSVAPPKEGNVVDRTKGYYPKTLSVTSIAGVGRLPQVSLPLAGVDSAPIGLSLIGSRAEDLFLLQAANAVERHRSISN